MGKIYKNGIEYGGGGGQGSGGSPVYISSTALSEEIGGTETVAIANLERADDGTIPTIDDMVLDTTLVYDDAGNLGVVTSIGTADVIITTTNTTTPAIELTQAEYDALTSKDPNTLYFITDATTILPAASSLNYSTSEQVVGTWINGKPLYQKTVECGALPNSSVKNIAHNITDADLVFIQNAFGFYPNGNQTTILPTSQDQTGKGLQLFVDRTNISIYCREYNLSDYTQSYITIQYTKTTD